MTNISEQWVAYRFWFLFQTNYDAIIPNVYLEWNSPEIDLLALRKSGYSDEIEIKLTKNDFLADFKKTVRINCSERELKHELLKRGKLPTNFFSFLIPKSLIDACEIPEYAGLYTFDEQGDIRRIKKPILLHKNKLSQEQKEKVLVKASYRYWNLLYKIKVIENTKNVMFF